MIFEVKQRKKELLSAEHVVFCGDEIVGEIKTTGGLDPEWPKIQMCLFDRSFSLCHDGNVLQFTKKSEENGEKMFRTFQVMSDSQGSLGNIYQFEKKSGFLSKSTYIKFAGGKTEISAYPIGYGREGYRTPIYRGNVQIALLTKPAEVKDDLHDYTIYARSEEDAAAALVVCGYVYANGSYHAGRKVQSGVYREYRKTADKFLLQMDNLQFEKNCE